MLWTILTSSTWPFLSSFRRKRPLPFAPWITNPIGYSGSTFLTKPAGDPVVTIGSTPWRDPLANPGAVVPWAHAENTPATNAITLTRAIFNEWRVNIITRLADSAKVTSNDNGNGSESEVRTPLAVWPVTR